MAAPHSGIPWDQDHTILDRLEEHNRLQQAGMSRKAICALQQLSPDAYDDDSNRLKELALRKVQDMALDTFNLVMIEHWNLVGEAKRIMADPSAENADKVGAIGRANTTLWQIAKLMRIAPETGDSAWNGKIPTGEINLNDNRQVHVSAGDPAVLAEMRQLVSDFGSKWEPRSDDERRRQLGSDNFKPAGEVWGDGAEIDADDDEED